MRRVVRYALCAMVLVVAGQVAAQEKSANTNMDILKDKIKADKKLLVADNMNLTDSEAKAFWPIYDAYQRDLQKINDRLRKAITTYAEAYNKDTLTDAQAKQITSDVIGVEESEVTLRRTYAAKLAKVLPGKKVARYLQIESKIRALVRFELASQIPLVE
jgi:Spy/CpxP family protein refolding chaperone